MIIFYSLCQCAHITYYTIISWIIMIKAKYSEMRDVARKKRVVPYY